MVLNFTPRATVRQPLAANDDVPYAAVVGNVALALRGIFPNVSPAQAEGAARDLMACVRPRRSDQLRARPTAH